MKWSKPVRAGAAIGAYLACSHAMGAGGSQFTNYNLTNLYSFNLSNYQADPGLVADSSGNIYGATTASDSTEGSVYELAANTHALTTLASFPLGTGPEAPGPVLVDSHGNLFGTSVDGGASNCGCVYKLPAGSDTPTVIASLSGTNGQFPVGLISDSAGNFYGIADAGGIGYTPNSGTGSGSLFKINAGTGAITPLALFNGSNGANPSSLLLDSAGNVFGTTRNGGKSRVGTIFEFAAGASAPTTLINFNSSSGAFPSDLISAGGGMFYGVTGGSFQAKGAGGYGTVFAFNSSTDALTTLLTFNNTNGANPESVDLGLDGNLYVATEFGGSTNAGVILELNPSTDASTMAATFSMTDGGGIFPTGSLLVDTSGDLFGTTTAGGDFTQGVIFELSPVPEPSSLSLLAITGVALLRRRRLTLLPPLSIKN